MIAFNEIDPIACATLRENFSGDVLERSIKDVRPEDVAGYERVHFFAGAGLWEIACELAGWKGPIWTASCPCQPFSVAGKGAGEGDPRHLWPDLFRLVRVCRPAVLVGEQVGGAAGDAWLDRVGADLESEGFTFWAAEAPACSVNAPHQRLRNWWVAVGDTHSCGRVGAWLHGGERQGISVLAGADGPKPYGADSALAMADARGPRSFSAAHAGICGAPQGERPRDVESERRDGRDNVADADRGGHRGRTEDTLGIAERRDAAERPSFWSGAEWLQCADGKARRAKPGVRLLVDGLGGRADLWRLAGNSIVPQLAAEVLIALKETLAETTGRPVRVDDLFG